MIRNSISQLDHLWKKVIEKVKNTTEVKAFSVFYNPTYIHCIEGKQMFIVCDNSMSQTILNQRYDALKSIVDEVFNSDFDLVFVTNEDIENNRVENKQNTQVFFKSCILDPYFTFDNYVVGISNKEATQAGLIVASNPGQLYNPLFIYGNSGLGKTHLLSAVGNYIKENQHSFKILYITAQDFLYQYLEYVKSSNQRSEDLSAYIKNFDVLLLDDIQMLKDKVKTLEFFFDIYQYFLQNKKQIVLTSDRLPSELEGIDSRLVSRFMDGLTVQIVKPSTEMCEDILKKKIEGAGLFINQFDPEVISFIASKFKSSIRELNGALNRIIFIKNLQHADRISMALATEALSSLIDVSDAKSKVSEQKILNAVSNYYNLSVSQITGKLKTSQIALARHISIYLMRQLLDVSLKHIGEVFSNRDHTTIMHSVNKVDEMLKTDKQVQIVITELKRRIKG